MASWSIKRKSAYFFAFIILVATAAGVPLFFLFYDSPTCTDGAQNGSERGIDCGGSCNKLCPADFSLPKVLWSYSSKVTDGIYNALAYAENPNQSVEAKLNYAFKLYDSKGLLVAERKGQSLVPAGQKFAVFAGGIRTGVRVPAKTTFEFTSSPDWKPAKALTNLRVLSIDVEEGAEPKAQAEVANDTVDKTFSSLDAFIILYDENDNRLAFSKTTIDRIGPKEKTTLYFTWPEAFPKRVLRSEVLFVAH